MQRPGLDYWIGAARATRESWGAALAPSELPTNVAAGVSTALVAIPLNVALAIACELPASVGLWTGAVAGVVGALLGGTKLQVTGPEVALAPMTLGIVTAHGLEGLLFCTIVAGALQIAFGVARLGRFVQAVPGPVVLGFMVAVGLMVIDGQLPRLLGLPESVRSMTGGGAVGLAGASMAALAVGAVVAVVTGGLPKVARRVPAPLVALLAAIAIVALFGLEVPRVPEVSGLVPALGAPVVGVEEALSLLPSAVALALLASLDSLLSAVSIDARLGTRHRSDQELAAQGVANVISGLVGGMPVAGAIVRSSAAIDAGGTNRVAPLVQSVVLGVVLLALGGLIDLLPITALAAILLVVGLKLVQPSSLLALYRRSKPDAAIAGVTTAAILALDFVLGVAIGVGAALLRMAVSHARPRVQSAASEHHEAGAVVLRVEGPLHFASVDALDEALAQVEGRAVVLDLGGVRAIDVTAADALRRLLEERARHGVEVRICGAVAPVAAELVRSGADAWLEAEARPARARAAARSEARTALLTMRAGDEPTA